jgi:hypothetical protein
VSGQCWAHHYSFEIQVYNLNIGAENFQRFRGTDRPSLRAVAGQTGFRIMVAHSDETNLNSERNFSVISSECLNLGIGSECR